MKAKNKYSLPVNEGDIEGVKKEDSPLHKGNLRYAIDYRLPERSSIFATANGEVIYVKDDSKAGGPDMKYLNEGNAIVIKHKNGEFTRYEHLKLKGVKVKVGEKVRTGQLIGYSGNTGYSNAPHLHFQVFKITGKNPDKDFETLEVDFSSRKGTRKSKNRNNLEGIVVLFSFIMIVLSVLFSTRITGRVINLEDTASNWISGVLFIIGIAGLFYYLARKHVKK